LSALSDILMLRNGFSEGGDPFGSRNEFVAGSNHRN
jgi:hypothetical protein